MPKNFRLHEIHITNFRSFDSLKLDKLRRINLIGGDNGSGKSSLLECIFLTLDSANPLAAIRPFQWRSKENMGSLDLSQLIREINKPASIKVVHPDGNSWIAISYTTPPPELAVSLSQAVSNTPHQAVGQSVASTQGILLTFTNPNSQTLKSFCAPMMEGFTGSVSGQTTIAPSCHYIGHSTKPSPQELAQAISDMIKSKTLVPFVDHMRMLEPQLMSFQILSHGNVPEIYAQIDGDLYPISLLGDGFGTLFFTLIAVMKAKNGVLLLDEVDSTIHYSHVREFWKNISILADEHNCQVFAVTHSLETIQNAARGVLEAEKQTDFCYIRLERNRNDRNSFSESNHAYYTYTANEVISAEDFGIEVR